MKHILNLGRKNSYTPRCKKTLKNSLNVEKLFVAYVLYQSSFCKVFPWSVTHLSGQTRVCMFTHLCVSLFSCHFNCLQLRNAGHSKSMVCKTVVHDRLLKCYFTGEDGCRRLLTLYISLNSSNSVRNFVLFKLLKF